MTVTVRRSGQVNGWTSKTVVRTKGVGAVTVRMSGQVKLLKEQEGSVTVTVRMSEPVKLL